MIKEREHQVERPNDRLRPGCCGSCERSTCLSPPWTVPITSLDSKTNTQIKAGTFNQRVRSGMVTDLFLMVVLVSESKQHGRTDTTRFLNLVFK